MSHPPSQPSADLGRAAVPPAPTGRSAASAPEPGRGPAAARRPGAFAPPNAAIGPGDL